MEEKRREEQIQQILETGRGPKEINKLSRKKPRIQKFRKEDGTLTSNSKRGSPRQRVVITAALQHSDLLGWCAKI